MLIKALATSVVQEEWFRVAAQNDSSKRLLDDFVTDLADTSLPVLRKVVNMTDASVRYEIVIRF